MTVAIYLPLLFAAGLTLIARRLARGDAPARTARGLVAAAAVAAVSSTWSLSMLALTLLDDVPPLSALDNQPGLDLPEPVAGPVALLAALVLAVGAIRVAADLGRRHATHRRLRAAGKPHGDLVVADWDAPMAVAVPGRPGHVLVTSGLLKLLDSDERRVVFAHERAHLRYRHHRLVAVAAAAAAVNPLLAPVHDAVSYLVERWADEDAAATVGDRDLTAQAVAHATLATAGSGPAATLGMNGAAAVLRVQALAEPAPESPRHRLLGPALVGAGCLAAALVATVEFVAVARAWL
jgi:hypothetical protein